MSKAEDLTGKTFGYLEVIKRADDRVLKSGRKKVCWLCRCKLCGTVKPVNAQDLKCGSSISCGCYQAYKGKQERNKKVCIICGKMFECPKSSKNVTCSAECRSIYLKRRRTGTRLSDSTRKKISASASGRDMSKLQVVATEAAMASPKSGRFETNIHAKDWHLISPEGKHYYFHSLSFWLRGNCLELFGCEPDSREYRNVRSGLASSKRAMMGKNYRCCTYKGWQVIPTDNDINNQ